MLRLCESVPRFSNFKFEISNLITQAIGISKQLHGWIESLKVSDIKGVKYLDKRERERYARKRDLDEFDREMAQFRLEFAAKLRREEQERNQPADADLEPS